MEDLVQEILLAVHSKRHTWRPGEPVAPWLFAIARYKAIDAYRRRGRRIEIDIGEMGDVFADPSATPTAVAHDVGRAVNPTLGEGQIHGGIAQGLGLALMEEYVPGRTENLHDYLIPTVGDMPQIDCILIEDPEPWGPFGAKGIGEPALVPTAPAILAGIRQAVGVCPDKVPVLPHRLRAAIRAAQTREAAE